MIIKTSYKVENYRYYEEAIEYFINYLLPKNKIKSITLEYNDELYDFGYDACVKINNWMIKPRNYIIYVNPYLNLQTMLLTLAHESVHIKQYAVGELIEIGDFTIWNRKIYHDTVNACQEDYNEFPWEKEAYAMEDVLKLSFLRHKMGALEQTFDINKRL